MASDGSGNFEGPERASRFTEVKQEPPEDINPQDFRSGYAPAAAGDAQGGPSAIANQDELADAQLLPTHEQDVPRPSQPHPDQVQGDDEGNGAGGHFCQPYAAFPHGDAPPPAQAAMMGVLALGGNGAGQRELTGVHRTQLRRPLPQGPAAQAANNPHRIAPVNRAAHPPSPTAAFPQHAVQQGHGVAGPSRVVHPGFPGAAFPAGPWNPQAFAPNPIMGFGHTPQGPTYPYPGMWGPLALANPLQRAMLQHGGAPQRQFIAGPSRLPGYPMLPAARAQFAAMAAQVPGAGPSAPPHAGQVAAPQHAPAPNPAPLVQPQPDPPAAAAVGAQAGPSHAAAAADPPAAAPQAPSVPRPPAGLGGFECVVCHARFAQYADCTQHVIFGHVVPEFTKRMSEVPAMIHAVPDPDADRDA